MAYANCAGCSETTLYASFQMSRVASQYINTLTRLSASQQSVSRYFGSAILTFLNFAILEELVSKQQILGSSKLKEFADDNFKCDENGEKFSKWVENSAGKGEIARYEQFLLFPQRFQKT